MISNLQCYWPKSIIFTVSLIFTNSKARLKGLDFSFRVLSGVPLWFTENILYTLTALLLSCIAHLLPMFFLSHLSACKCNGARNEDCFYQTCLEAMKTKIFISERM